MATPASSAPDSKCYTAGDCVLEVQAQPSALSRWSAQPVAESLTFKLWLRGYGEEGGREADERSLLAEGDRTDLRLLAQYFQHQTQKVLTIASLNRSGRSDLSAAPNVPQNLQLPTPLSYLQLCDVTTVLNQYEQSVRLLPVAIRPAIAEAVSLEEARHRSAARPATRSMARPRHRRQRNTLWASSAAAALFAVGLTSTLWLRDSSLQQINTASESAAPAPQSDSIESDGSVAPADVETFEQDLPSQRNRESAQDRESVQESANQDSLPNTRDTGDAPAPAAENPTVARRPANESVPNEPAPAQTAPPPVNPNPTETASPPPAPRAPGAPGASTRSRPTAETAPEAIEAPSPETQDAEVEELLTADAPEAAADVPSDDLDAETDVFTPPPADGAPTEQTGGASRGTLPPQQQAPQQQESTAQAESATVLEAEAAIDEPAAAESTDARAIALQQIRTYFQQRWQASESTQLTYRLQLSATGEVVVFEGLDEVSQGERDRILPASAPPTFNRGNASEPIEFRLLLLPNGVVQVL